MKRERVEDLGRIYERSRRLELEIEESWGQHVQSKHTEESFREHYSKEDNLAWLHSQLRHLKTELEEISNLSFGDLPDESY